MKTIEKIPWFSQQPPDYFPCLVCRSGRRAIERVHFHHHELDVTMVMCAECAAKSEDELWEIVK